MSKQKNKMTNIEPSRLHWLTLLEEAAAAIAQRPVRTLLTALGTILGVGAFVATNGLAQTARTQVSSRFDALRATEVRVQDSSPDGSNPFPADASVRLERLNGINHAGVIYKVPDGGTLQARTRPLRSARQATLTPIIAADPGALEAALPEVNRGRLYDEFHERRSERVAVIGRAAAAELNLATIDNQPAVFIGDVAYTVIGIIDDVQRNPDLLVAVTIPTSSAARDFSPEGAIYEVLIDTAPGAAALVGRQAPLALRPEQPQRLQSLVPPDPTTLRNQISQDLTGLFLVLSVLALGIGTIAIANAAMVSVLERKSEIGLRRALGATRRHIWAQITLEAALTGIVASLIGISVALNVCTVVAKARGWTLTIAPSTVAAAPILGLVTGAIAGLLPAIKASRTPPADTLKG